MAYAVLYSTSVYKGKGLNADIYVTETHIYESNNKEDAIAEAREHAESIIVETFDFDIKKNRG